MSHYKIIEGKNLVSELLELADKAVQGKGDGRISVKDAEQLFDTVHDGGIYADAEKDTVKYIQSHYHWTEGADEWFKSRVASLNYIRQAPAIMTPEELSKLPFGKKDVLETESDRVSRNHNLRAATAQTYQDHDEIGIIVKLENGKRVKVLSNFIELEGEFVELRGGFAIPVRAIEEVEV